MAKSHAPLTPHSRLLARGSIDGRTREGRFLAAVRAELAGHLGGEPSAAQRVLIDRVAWLRLRVALFDEKLAQGAELTGHDARVYLAHSNALIRAMREIGHKAVVARPVSLTAALAEAAR
jgi:hypothetical protein